MNIGSPLITTGTPIPVIPEEEVVDQTDIPTFRSDYRFSGVKIGQTDDIGITVAYQHQHQPHVWSLRSTWGYTPRLANP
jgi:hypothetical protein